MRTFIASILAAGLVLVLGGYAVIYAGLYDVAATEPHWPATHWILETARVRSIKAHATDVTIPAGFDDAAKIRAGARV